MKLATQHDMNQNLKFSIFTGGLVQNWNSTRAPADNVVSRQGQTVPLFQRDKVSSAGRWIPHPWYANGPASGAKRHGSMVFDDLGKSCNNRQCFTCVQAELRLYWHQRTHHCPVYSPTLRLLRKILELNQHSFRCLLNYFFGLTLVVCHFKWLIDGTPNIPYQRPMATATSEDTNEIHASHSSSWISSTMSPDWWTIRPKRDGP